MADEIPHLTTPSARLCFPSVFEPQENDEGHDPLYNCVLLFDPSNFTQKDIALMAAIKDAGLGAIAEKFGEKVIKDRSAPALTGDIRWPILDAAPKEGQWAGFIPGRTYLRVKSKFRPGIGRVVLGSDGRPKVEETDDQDLFYPGAIVRAKVSPWAYKNKTQGVRFTLESILFLKHGERLVQERTVGDRFADGDLDGVDYDTDLEDGDGIA